MLPCILCEHSCRLRYVLETYAVRIPLPRAKSINKLIICFVLRRHIVSHRTARERGTLPLEGSLVFVQNDAKHSREEDVRYQLGH